jgi:hypothetical protein
MLQSGGNRREREGGRERERQPVGVLARRNIPSQGRYLHTTTQTQKMQTNTHSSSRIRTHDAIVREGDDTSCLTPLRHSGRPYISDGANRVLGGSYGRIECGSAKKMLYLKDIAFCNMTPCSVVDLLLIKVFYPKNGNGNARVVPEFN